MTAPSDPQRCQCGTYDCKGFVSQHCEASPKQCARADGCDCPFHSAAPPKKRGKHSKASSSSYIISQDAESYEILWRMCCLMFSPDVLQRRTQSANVRWFAAQLMRLAQHSADEPGHGEKSPTASTVSGVAAPARPDESGHGGETSAASNFSDDLSAMLLQLDAAESPVAEPQDDIEDVAHPGCVAALVSGMGDASPQPGQDPISFLECSGVLSSVRAYLGRGQRTFDLASATPAVMLESLERGRIAEVMIQDHHKPKRMTFLDWNLDRGHLRSLWDYWSSDLYEFTQFHARDKDKLFQQGFLAEHPTPASRLQDWIDIPMKSFFALRGLEDNIHIQTATASWASGCTSCSNMSCSSCTQTRWGL